MTDVRELYSKTALQEEIHRLYAEIAQIKGERDKAQRDLDFVVEYVQDVMDDILNSYDLDLATDYAKAVLEKLKGY